MTALLVMEMKSSQGGPLVNNLVAEGILETIFVWSLDCGEYRSPLKIEQLKLYELLIR